MYFIKSLAVSLGKHIYPQSELAEKMRAKISTLPNSSSICQAIGFTYEHSGIKKRGFEIDIQESSSRKDWYLTVNQANLSLSVRVLEKLFTSTTKASDCDAFVVVCSSYGGFPGLSRQLQQRFGFPLNALCFDLTGLGCIGATHALYLAHSLLETNRCKNVCVLSVESMGTHTHCRQYKKLPSMSNIVANCLAADGAVALIMSSQSSSDANFSYRKCSLTTKLWENSLDLNVLSACEDNQPIIIVGKEIRTRLLGEFNHFVDPDMLADPIYFHPGGIALMKVVTDAYPQLSKTTELSLSKLFEEGNIGAPSVLSVFHKALDQKLPISPRFRLAAFGPGKVTAVLLFDEVEAAY